MIQAAAEIDSPDVIINLLNGKKPLEGFGKGFGTMYSSFRENFNTGCHEVIFIISVAVCSLFTFMSYL